MEGKKTKLTEKMPKFREMARNDLLKKLDELKTELYQLRVGKSSTSNASKLPKIKLVRKDIARVLTVINQKRKTALRKKYSKARLVPLDLRPKLTRSMRRELTVKQQTKRTLREIKRAQQFPQKKFAVLQD